MSLTIGNKCNYPNYTIDSSITVAANTTTDNSAISQTSNNELNTRNHYHPNGVIKFVEEGNSGVYEGYVDGIKMDEKFLQISDMDAAGASNSQLMDRIIQNYDKTDVEKLKEIFGL